MKSSRKRECSSVSAVPSVVERSILQQLQVADMDSVPCHGDDRCASAATVMPTEPLRLLTRTSGPPSPTVPTTLRLDTAPRTDVPVTLTEPERVLASTRNGAPESIAKSTPPDPVDASHVFPGVP